MSEAPDDQPEEHPDDHQAKGHWRDDAVALGFGIGVFGVTFGVLATTAGLTVAQTSAMSLLVFTGASQFAAVSIVAAGGSPIAALGGALLLAARNALYGLPISRVVHGSRLKRLFAAQLIIDESTAMSTARRDPEEATRAFWWAGISVFVFWNVGTLLGAIGGNSIGNPETYGLDAAFPAGLLALVLPALKLPSGRAAAATGAVVALAATPFTPEGVPILLAAAGVPVGLWVARRRGEPDAGVGDVMDSQDPRLP